MKERQMPQSRKPGQAGRGGNFEERLSKLEKLSAVMKEGSLSLEEAVKNFEEGVKLARGLEKDLSRIERRVEILINNPGTEEEKPELGLFPELEED
jgi:exodeoxyribonuclease VII small subunit